MAAYYADANAVADGDGSQESPYTNDQFFALMPLEDDGDEFYLKRDGRFIPPEGTDAIVIDANNVRIGCYGVGRKPMLDCRNTQRGIRRVAGNTGQIIEDIEITNIRATSTSGIGILASVTDGDGRNASNLIIRRCEVHNIRSAVASIDAIGIQGFGADNVYEDNVVYDTGNDAFWHSGKRGFFNRCIARNYGCDPLNSNFHPDGIQLSGYIGGTKIIKCLIDGRQPYRERDTSCIIASGVSDPEEPIVIRKNRTFQRNGLLISLNMNIETTAFIESNYVSGGSVGISLATNASAVGSRITGNRLHNMWDRGISCNQAATLIGTNTVIGTDNTLDTSGIATGIREGFGGSGIAIQSNVVVNFIRGFVTSGTNPRTKNIAYNCATPINGAAGDLVTTDPLLDDNDVFPVTSPCYQAGQYNSRGKDSNGRKLKRTPDIGAYQHYEQRAAVPTARTAV